jgi:hypothetical protein
MDIHQIHNSVREATERASRIRKLRESRAPEVGLYWLSFDCKKVVYQVSLPTREIMDKSAFVGVSDDHYTSWERLRKSGALQAIGYGDYEYEEIPRGRVLYSREHNSYVILAGEDWWNETAKNTVIREFNLPRDHVVVEFDFHYRLDNLGENIFDNEENDEDDDTDPYLNY